MTDSRLHHKAFHKLLYSIYLRQNLLACKTNCAPSQVLGSQVITNWAPKAGKAAKRIIIVDAALTGRDLSCWSKEHAGLFEQRDTG